MKTDPEMTQIKSWHMVFKIPMINIFKIVKIIKYFNTYLSVTHKTSKKKKVRTQKIGTTQFTNSTLVNLFRILHSSTDYVVFKVHTLTFMEINHMDHKSFKKFQQMETRVLF